MKKGILIISMVLITFMYSCGNSPEAGRMCDEICLAMEKFTDEEPMSKYDAASDLIEIKKKQEYSTVTDAQLKKVMMKKCPEGWKKYLTLKDK